MGQLVEYAGRLRVRSGLENHDHYYDISLLGR
jgi:hypothetical protein